MRPRQESGLLKVDAPATLQAGERSAINFHYEIPASKPRYGSINDVLEIWVDGIKSEKVILVHGVAIDPPNKTLKDRAPKVEASEIIIKFGAVKRHDSERTEHFAITNKGKAPLKIRAVEVLHSTVTLSLSEGDEIAPGETRNVELRLNPLRIDYGPLSERIRIVTNDPEHPMRTLRVTAIVVE